MRGITFVSADDSLGRLLSYAQLLEGAALRLGAFQAMGIRQGEPLLMQVAELDDHILALWGCLLGGIAPVNISLPPKYDASQHSKSAPSGLHSCDTSFEGSGLLFIAGRSPLGRYGSLVYLFHCMPPSITLQASNGVVLKLLGVLDDLGARHILASPQSVLLLRKLLDDEGRSHVRLLDVSHLELQNGTRASTCTVSHAWAPSVEICCIPTAT